MSHKLITRNTAAENMKEASARVWKSEDEVKLVESMQRKFGIDIKDKAQFPVMESGFSFKKLQAKLEEADQMGAFPQVLRAGVQTIVNAAYETVPTTHEEWTHTVASTKLEELYAPLHGIGFPSNVGENEVYPEVGAAGLDIKLANRKFGTLFPVSKELLDYDQTGQFQKQSGLLGQYAKQVLEVLSYAKLASVAGMKYGNMTVPVSETKPSSESVYPWSTALVGGGATRPTTYAALSQPSLQNAFIALMNQKNLLGLKMAVQPDTIVTSPAYKFDLATLLNSSFYPTGATPGLTGAVGAINPIQGIAKPVVSRFLFDHLGQVNGDSKAWYLMDSKVPWFVVQVFEAAVVEMENPTSGQSFDRDVIRFKLRVRANADHIDPRFCFQGNNGSV